MANLDAFLHNGPTDGDQVAGLEELRRVILLDGIPSNSEGMVRVGCAQRHALSSHYKSQNCAYTSGSSC